MGPRTLGALIFCNIVWSAHPAMGKLVLQGFPAPQGAWLRYFSALLSYVVAVVSYQAWVRFRKAQETRITPDVPRPTFHAFMIPVGRYRKEDWAILTLLGFSAFCFSPLLQMTGLAASQATESALIVAMEPLIAVLLARIFLGEKVSGKTWFAFSVALLGFALLSDWSASGHPRVEASRFTGNLLLLVSLLGEAIYSLAGRKLIVRYAPAAVFGSSLGIGVLFLTLGTLFLSGLPSIQTIVHMPWESALGLLWLGPLGTGFSYLIWMLALEKAPVASLALTLFIQPVFGPIWGVLMLGERLAATQVLGCALILASVVGHAWVSMRSRRAA